eukprot:COSAG06_NODE_84_length_25090_cov_20.561042_4_plen_98_part_00
MSTRTGGGEEMMAVDVMGDVASAKVEAAVKVRCVSYQLAPRMDLYQAALAPRMDLLICLPVCLPSTMRFLSIGQNRSMFIGNSGLFWICFDRIIENA